MIVASRAFLKILEKSRVHNLKREETAMNIDPL